MKHLDVLITLPMNILNIPGEPLLGRYVIVQMDNGDNVPLNLREVVAFGEAGETQKTAQ